MSDIGKKIWIFPDAFLPAKGRPYKISKNKDQFGHESLCMVNSSDTDALLNISFYYEEYLNNPLLPMVPCSPYCCLPTIPGS